ncbi:hypothetical protein Gotur_034176 [Gossypium turneri]
MNIDEIIKSFQSFKMNLKRSKNNKIRAKNNALQVASLKLTRKSKSFEGFVVSAKQKGKKNEEQLSKYVAFTSKIVSKVATDSENYNDSDDEISKDFMDTYKTILDKGDWVFKINMSPTDENSMLKQENRNFLKKL